MSGPEDKEGWEVPLRLPLIAAGATLLGLVVALVTGGWLYARSIEPATQPPPIAFPAPRLETVRTTPSQHRADRNEPAPPSIDAAMAATAAKGPALWQEQGR